MFSSRFFSISSSIFLSIFIGCSIFLIYYPVFLGCEYSSVRDTTTVDSTMETFRILLVGDPQLEGQDKKDRLGPFIGQMDEWFNDLYFRHVFRTMLVSFPPQMVVLLGDLLSSQDISDGEFYKRVERLRWSFKLDSNQHIRMVYLGGNHDIGYGYDMDDRRVDRFVAAFGPLNQEWTEFGHRFVKINNNNLDGASAKQLADRNWDFISSIRGNVTTEFPLILLQHIPFHKPWGLCSDGPAIDYSYRDIVLSQSMLSKNTSARILKTLRPRLVFTGHDHVGCFTTHEYAYDDGSYRTYGGLSGDVQRFYCQNSGSPFVRQAHGSEDLFANEFTVRATMAEYSGNIGILEIRKMDDTRFEYTYRSCLFVDHISLWTIVIAGLVCLGISFICALSSTFGAPKRHQPKNR